MSDDWKIGDLAVCVTAGGIQSSWGWHTGVGLTEGCAYRVLRVVASCPMSGQPIIWIEGVPSRHGSLAARFRKIRPDEHAPCEEEFVDLLNLSKKRVTA